MVINVLDPTFEEEPTTFDLAPRIDTLSGKKVGFISNGKEGTLGFFSHLENLLHARFKVADVIWETKDNYSAPAEAPLIERAQAWDLAITGLGD